jgi:hypothetical protein
VTANMMTKPMLMCAITWLIFFTANAISCPFMPADDFRLQMVMVLIL